jgi:hypothetical protein
VQTHVTISPAALALLPFVFFVGLWCLVSFLVGKLSGWSTLEQRFGSSFPFPGQTWKWKSARMRRGTNYNNCLTIGADPTGLYLATVFFFRIGHPSLFIPWTEISLLGRRKIFFVEFAEFRLGREEQVPFLIRAKLADQIRAAAASSWPIQVVSLKAVGKNLLSPVERTGHSFLP